MDRIRNAEPDLKKKPTEDIILDFAIEKNIISRRRKNLHLASLSFEILNPRLVQGPRLK